MSRLLAACREAEAAGRTGDGPAPTPAPDDLRATLLAAADTAGASRAALHAAVAHVTARHQFGGPLAELQAVQHHLADMLLVVDALWLSVEHAALDDPPAPAPVAVAAVLAAERAPVVCTTAHQLTGAAGLYADHPLGGWTRRVFATAAALGPVGAHLGRLAPGSDTVGP
jgi:alkylation response protein AidB-like acyl-CoA dehydrogenase